MPPKNGPNSAPNQQNGATNNDRLLIDQAVRGFVENGFETAGNAFYQKFLDGRALEKDFFEYLKTKEGMKSVLPDREKFPNSIFAAEIRKAAFSLENLRKAAREKFAFEYDVPADKAAELEKRVFELRPSELRELVNSAKERADIVQ